MGYILKYSKYKYVVHSEWRWSGFESLGKTKKSFFFINLYSFLQSIVHLVFRDEKDPRSECEHWQYWHSQQPNPQQRAFDIGKFYSQKIKFWCCWSCLPCQLEWNINGTLAVRSICIKGFICALFIIFFLMTFWSQCLLLSWCWWLNPTS